MRAVVQRVTNASVTVENETVGAIGPGIMVLIGVADTDTDKDLKYIVDKVMNLRIFDDENGVMNKSITDIPDAGILVVSQFTLYGNCRKGRRPSFTDAASPELGNRLYEQFLADCEALGYKPQHGQFGADMQVESINDGPVTLILDTQQLMEEPRRK